ncbi:MAG: UDP-N-acetylmuramoyl-tripeptide--D-alanyl-D-alanine ligase [Oscillospiraceae bacterium]|jgi:UDP-N-acetylmuramoyl-tripeptide--D-alanyl-D-alanine ligase|nr:UDP-N-acetylmuramoyl-tripeptide--D-alanyl-D-alanine ligase [Oscillospiraceae bacterium]
MLALTIEKIAEVMGGRLFSDEINARRVITRVVTDSREAVPGALFFCFRGERTDGHDHVADAFARGALAAVTTREIEIPTRHKVPAGAYILVNSAQTALGKLGAYYRSRLNIPIIGVAGSVGKTTAKEMIAAVLSERFNVHKTRENLNNELGVPLTLLGTGEEHGAAVIEMGISDFGEMTRLAEIVRPDICVMTAIGRCHLEKLGDLDGVLRAKAEVFAKMPETGAAVLNGDDALLSAYDPGLAKPGLTKITFGTDARCDWRAENIASDGTRSVSFDIISPSGERARAKIPAFGTHLVYSALAAAAVGAKLGVSLDETARGLAKYRPVGGRANVVETGKITVIDDCYNANPNSVSAALRSLSALSTVRRAAILGDMRELGAGAEAAHREIGKLAGELGIDCLICCGEMAEFIFKGFIASGSEAEAYFFPFRDALFEKLPALIRDGDAVLVKASHSEKFEQITQRLLAPAL